MSKCYEAFDRKSIENSVFKGNLVANGGYFLVNGYLRSVGTGRDLSLKRLFTIHRDTVAIRKDRSRPVPTKSSAPSPHLGLIALSIHPRN